MRNQRVPIECRGCGETFHVSPSRRKTAAFCSAPCYQQNQHKRRGNDHTQRSPQDMMGARFSRLTVIAIEKGLYRCRCDCGEVRSYGKKALTSGRVKSCGCYNRDKGRKPGAETARNMWFRYLQEAAKSRGLDFELSAEEALELCQQDCAYCGAAPAPWEGAKRAYLTSARLAGTKEPDLAFAESKVIDLNGLDRIDPAVGYTSSNVNPCCSQCNTAKLDMTLPEFKLWIQRAYNHLFGTTE